MDDSLSEASRTTAATSVQESQQDVAQPVANLDQDDVIPDQAQQARQMAATNMMDEEEKKEWARKLYDDAEFRQEKEALEKQIEQASEVTVQSKNFLGEMDDFLKDLETWKTKRHMHQDDAQAATQQPVEEVPDIGLAQIEDAFMARANERERQILEQLRAINIDPTKDETIIRAKESDACQSKSYESIMAEIESKEALLREKEDEFIREAREEVQLDEDKQAQVDNKKKELEAILANMQKLEAEFDEMDAEFDTGINDLLKPQAALDGPLP